MLRLEKPHTAGGQGTGFVRLRANKQSWNNDRNSNVEKIICICINEAVELSVCYRLKDSLVHEH